MACARHDGKKAKGGPLLRAAFRGDQNQWLPAEAVIQPWFCRRLDNQPNAPKPASNMA